MHHLQSDQQFSAGGERFSIEYVWQCLRDPKTYIASKLFIKVEGTQILTIYKWACTWDSEH